MLGLTYWPRRKGYTWWQAFDLTEVRDELAHVASLGLGTVRFCLRWEDVQPAAGKLGSAVLRAFERALDVAADQRLRVIAAFFPVTLGGGLHLPRWASRENPVELLHRSSRRAPVPPLRTTGRSVRGDGAKLAFGRHVPRVIYEWEYHSSDPRDLFADESIRTAQQYLVREVAGYFSQHPALAAWQLGEGFEQTHRPGSRGAVTEWYGGMVEFLRAQAGSLPTLGITSPVGLLSPAGPRPEDIAAVCDLAGVALDMPLPFGGAKPLDNTPQVFVYALAAALAGRPLVATGLGLPTAPDGQTGPIDDSMYGQPVWPYRAHPQEQAEYIGAALERLFHVGARGVLLADYADYSGELTNLPPLDRSICSRSRGLVDLTGREKPLATAVRTFASTVATRPEPAGLPALDLDRERYWRDPRSECARLWREFNVAEA